MKQIDEKTYVYIFVRRDIPVEQQLVQAAHAALEVGLKYPYQTNDPSSVIVLGVKNKYQLEKAQKKLNDSGVKTEMFFQPDWDYGHTAFATEALTEDQRHFCRGYNLWKS